MSKGEAAAGCIQHWRKVWRTARSGVESSSLHGPATPVQQLTAHLAAPSSSHIEESIMGLRSVLGEKEVHTEDSSKGSPRSVATTSTLDSIRRARGWKGGAQAKQMAQGSSVHEERPAFKQSNYGWGASRGEWEA
ncbi:hypothetical protein LR48_Vigan226s000300 [Vigna angularis]|uniref:Uncharacterized protein n=1 Tax=Phaseolus angularis TaxID=3914 RepID=A0A0L9T7J1_PHAAN|nr:hypothetical protein LR48_Vigan226s000300 [Vigna angularis]